MLHYRRLLILLSTLPMFLFSSNVSASFHFEFLQIKMYIHYFTGGNADYQDCSK